MQLEPFRSAHRLAPQLSMKLAGSEAEIRAAQQLRWAIFAEEQGATLTSPMPGYDIDDFDCRCDHLIVTDARSDRVVGTYRMLTAEAAAYCGGYYSEQEFDLGRLKRSGKRLLEIGRSCVHPDHRNGATIALLWSGIAAYMLQSRHHALIGCASVPLRGMEGAGSALARSIARRYAAPQEYSAFPKRDLPFADDATSMPNLPPLLKGYLRSGAMICGAPCWDPDFQCADVLVYLGVENVEQRYARRFLASGGPEPVNAA